MQWTQMALPQNYVTIAFDEQANISIHS